MTAPSDARAQISPTAPAHDSATHPRQNSSPRVDLEASVGRTVPTETRSPRTPVWAIPVFRCSARRSRSLLPAGLAGLIMSVTGRGGRDGLGTAFEQGAKAVVPPAFQEPGDLVGPAAQRPRDVG